MCYAMQLMWHLCHKWTNVVLGIDLEENIALGIRMNEAGDWVIVVSIKVLQMGRSN